VDSSSGLLQLITSCLNLGVLGLVFWLFVGGKLHASSEMEQATGERDQWHKAFEDERAAHQATRESLAVASDRAEAAVEAAKVTTKLLEAVQQQREG
jgi:hypothetical protein